MSAREYLLDDAGMRDFIANGYVVVKADFPTEFHQSIYQQTEEVFAKEGNPGNNLLPRIPQLQSIFTHPRIHGALSSILGPDYYMHAHRYCHINSPGSQGQNIHKDSWSRRHHRTRWAMAFYYPQDVSADMGPTGVVPGSQYRNKPLDGDLESEVPLCGEAGTMTIVHYNLWHRATPNHSDEKRYMMKFLFTRMAEPECPSWDSTAQMWPESSEKRQLMWQSMWDWHRGRQGRVGKELASHSDIPALTRELHNEDELACLEAAYALGALGAPALPALIEILQHESEEARCNAAYALSAMGGTAVPALIEAADHASEWTRASAVDILGDIGPPARPAVPALAEALSDTSERVRNYAAAALGTLGAAAQEAVPALIETLRDPDEWVRRNSTLSLAQMGPAAAAAIPALIEALDDDNRYVCANALKALDCLGTRAAREALLNSLFTARWCPITTKESMY